MGRINPSHRPRPRRQPRADCGRDTVHTTGAPRSAGPLFHATRLAGAGDRFAALLPVAPQPLTTFRPIQGGSDEDAHSAHDNDRGAGARGGGICPARTTRWTAALARRARRRSAGRARKDDGDGRGRSTPSIRFGSRSSPGSRCATRSAPARRRSSCRREAWSRTDRIWRPANTTTSTEPAVKQSRASSETRLCAPNVAFVPEGNFDPPSGALMYPGSIGVSDATFQALLTRYRQQLSRDRLRERHSDRRQRRQSAWDEGGRHRRFPPSGLAGKARIHYIADYYDGFNQVIEYAEKTFGWKQVPDGSHDDALITAIIMTVDPDHVRMTQRIAKGKTATNSISLMPVEKTIEIGKADRQPPRRHHRRGDQEGDWRRTISRRRS